jgi:hypothetical protein
MCLATTLPSGCRPRIGQRAVQFLSPDVALSYRMAHAGYSWSHCLKGHRDLTKLTIVRSTIRPWCQAASPIGCDQQAEKSKVGVISRFRFCSSTSIRHIGFSVVALYLNSGLEGTPTPEPLITGRFSSFFSGVNAPVTSTLKTLSPSRWPPTSKPYRARLRRPQSSSTWRPSGCCFPGLRKKACSP